MLLYMFGPNVLWIRHISENALFTTFQKKTLLQNAYWKEH